MEDKADDHILGLGADDESWAAYPNVPPYLNLNKGDPGPSQLQRPKESQGGMVDKDGDTQMGMGQQADGVCGKRSPGAESRSAS